MAKMSVASNMFEWILRRIFPHKETAKFQRLRRRIYYPILNEWGNHCYCATIDEEGEEIEGAKVRVTGFIFWYVSGYIRWAYRASGLAPWICKRYGHKIIDCSSAGPESGNMDHACRRCGEYWHAPLY